MGNKSILTFTPDQWTNQESGREAQLARELEPGLTWQMLHPDKHEILVRSSDDRVWQRHLFFDRREALSLLDWLESGIVRSRACFATRTSDDEGGVTVRLYGRNGGPAEASLELRAVR